MSISDLSNAWGLTAAEAVDFLRTGYVYIVPLQQICTGSVFFGPAVSVVRGRRSHLCN